MSRQPVQIGAIFESVGGARHRWEVTEIIEKPGHPLHVRLTSLRSANDVRLFAAAALADRTRFRALPEREGAH
jgi:hypothetical protein